ncbi:acyltransferase family protein [Pseudomonas nunensis]|uniref:Acyltransferase n=1 Tax=Pseudomonas nunensis TaxID=2961896 RepID=A0ABY5E871_9PSED|nr:acyltransferase [Pseudomonas nunensis]KPN91739.1 acyltransferase [Pseudomonas nunensis]MCL5229560.1 acyltransferase [Pseudomonas nunensis]UTO11944.1 acyltransferase [Pseudomonas nunensis]
MSSKKKSLEIETLRGLACLLLVLYHVIGPLGGGLKIDVGSPFRVIADSMVYVRMPLFTFISGYIYSLYKIRGNDFQAYVAGKVRRLIVPLFCVGVPFSVLQAVGPGVNKEVGVIDALLSFYVPVNHFWFLQAVFIIFMFVGLLEWRGLLQTVTRQYLLLAFAAAVFLLPPFAVDAFGINGAVYLLPFFVLGMIGHEKVSEIRQTFRVIGPLVFVLISLVLLYVATVDRGLIVDRRSLVGLLVGCVSCVALLSSNLQARWLIWLGGYSYGIFLFHVLFAAASRLVLARLGVTADSVLVLGGVTCGLLGPVLLSSLFSRFNFTSVLFLGERATRKKPPIIAMANP